MMSVFGAHSYIKTILFVMKPEKTPVFLLLQVKVFNRSCRNNVCYKPDYDPTTYSTNNGARLLSCGLVFRQTLSLKYVNLFLFYSVLLTVTHTAKLAAIRIVLLQSELKT